MVQIISDNRKAEKILKKTAEIIVKNGGFIDESLEIRCVKGDVSVHSPGNRALRQIFKIPHGLLVPFESFDIGIKKDKFYIRLAQDDATPVQRELMQAMLDLYNINGKLAQHRATSPWFLYKDDPKIMDLFLKCRFGPEFKKMRVMLDEGRIEEFERLTFFKTRLLGCRLHKQWRRQSPVLLPLIDALNHYVHGAEFNHLYAKENAALSLFCRQKPDSDECYANYGRMDALDTYLHYGFIDAAVPFLRSVPLQLDLGPHGVIDVQAAYGRANVDELPESLKDLTFFMPAITVDHARKHAQLTHLFIPGENGILSLRRILGYVITTLAPDLNEQEVVTRITDSEKAILTTNIRLYSDMEGATHGISDEGKKADLLNFISLQKEKIEGYISVINRFYQEIEGDSNS